MDALAIYAFSIKNQPGKINVNAGLQLEKGNGEEICQIRVVHLSEDLCCRAVWSRYVDQLGPDPECIPDVFALTSHLNMRPSRPMSKAELIKAQKKDHLAK